MLVEPPPPLLPATLGKLHRIAEGDPGDGLGKLDAASLTAQDKAVLAEDGLKRFATSDYKDGAQLGTVTIYRFIDASGAISAFDYFHRTGMHAEKLGDSAASSGGSLLVRSGVNLVQENFKGVADRSVMTELIDHLPKVAGPAAMDPLLPSLLPAKGFDRESVMYALGPAGYAAMGGVLPAAQLGFDKSAEAVTAKSSSKSGGLLTLILYPTPEIAGDHLRSLTAVAPAASRREGPLVVIASGAWPPGEAQKIVDTIHLRSEVTFDKPMPVEFHAEVKKTYSLLTSIAIFCGFAALAMLVLGLFFGGGRALIRVAQGKPAASEPEFLRIDLRGDLGGTSDKPSA